MARRCLQPSLDVSANRAAGAPAYGSSVTPPIHPPAPPNPRPGGRPHHTGSPVPTITAPRSGTHGDTRMHVKMFLRAERGTGRHGKGRRGGQPCCDVSALGRPGPALRGARRAAVAPAVLDRVAATTCVRVPRPAGCGHRAAPGQRAGGSSAPPDWRRAGRPPVRGAPRRSDGRPAPLSDLKHAFSPAEALAGRLLRPCVVLQVRPAVTRGAQTNRHLGAVAGRSGPHP